MKRIHFKQHFATTFRPLTQKNHGFSIPEHYFSPLYHACNLRWKEIDARTTMVSWEVEVTTYAKKKT